MTNRWPSWTSWAALLVAYVVGGVVAHLLPRAYLMDLTLATYAVAEVGALAFIVRYLRTDWREHPWGRHVMAFMVCLQALFLLTLSRRIFGVWPGLVEVGFLASVTFAGIIWWRFHLQGIGARRNDRRARRTTVTADDD